MGVLDTAYKWDLTDEEACEIGRRSIAAATHRDAYSGGFINVFLIKETGWVQISHQDCNELLWDKYLFRDDDEKKSSDPSSSSTATSSSL